MWDLSIASSVSIRFQIECIKFPMESFRFQYGSFSCEQSIPTPNNNNNNNNKVDTSTFRASSHGQKYVVLIHVFHIESCEFTHFELNYLNSHTLRYRIIVHVRLFFRRKCPHLYGLIRYSISISKLACTIINFVQIVTTCTIISSCTYIRT